MKNSLLKLITLLAFTLSTAVAHEGVELGPKGGRILEFSKNETMHGELTVKDGRFQIELLDKNMKPVALNEQQLTATSGDRAKPEKIAVEKKDGKYFTGPMVKDGQWIIFQFRESAKGKAVTARLEYDTKNCEACNNPEWLCKCGEKKDAKKK
jgi:hypothetical protein